MRYRRVLVRGRWCVVTRTGWVIGLRYSGPRMARPRRLPDPLARHRDALAGFIVVAAGSAAIGAVAAYVLTL